MPFSLNDIIYGGVLPAFSAAIFYLLLARLLPDDLRHRYPAAVATFAGFLLGYTLISLAPWQPTAHWHWLPYAFLAAAVVGPIASAESIRSFERLLTYSIVAIVVSWQLVPNWEDLSPSRITYLLGTSITITLLAATLEPLSKRIAPLLLLLTLWVTMSAAAVVLALSGSLRFAQITLASAAALFGCAVAAGILRKEHSANGIALLFSVMAVGSLLVGQVNSFSEVPFAAYAVLPLAPLMLWLSTFGPLSKLTGKKRCCVHAFLPLLVIAAAVSMAVLADLNSSDGY